MANQQTRREGVVASDTIAAAATPAGSGAIGIIRISGPEARTIAEQICGKPLSPRQATFSHFRTGDGEVIDSGIAISYPGPASFTGEDVVELQCHGSPVVVDWLVESACSLGARRARPGEFSLRAFLNDKLDLLQAEAIADLIESGSRSQARAAGQSLEGVFSAHVARLQDELTALRVRCESWLDFPDEDIDHAAVAELERRWHELRQAIAAVESAAAYGRHLSDRLHVALAGAPNVGKSSLMNRLSGIDAAIVTDIAGTTRDTIREDVNLGGIAVTLVDMAGLRRTEDRIEGEGVRRAEAEIARADHVLWVADVQAGLEAAQGAARQALPSGKPFSLVLNKIDVIDALPREFEDKCAVFALSAKTGAGVDALRHHLRKLAGLDETHEGAFSARQRHLDALARMREHVEAAGTHLTTGLELAAEELKAAQADLDELTGRHTSDDLLGEIFSHFCIGK